MLFFRRKFHIMRCTEFFNWTRFAGEDSNANANIRYCEGLCTYNLRERAREGVTVEFHQYEIGHIYRDPCIANSDEATVRRKCSWRFALRFVQENRKEAHSISMHMLSCWANGTPLSVCQLFGWKSCLIMLWGQFRISSTLVPFQSL